MNILQRRNSQTSTSALSQRLDRLTSDASARWQALPARDKLALIVLSVFLFLFIGGYGGYTMHIAAKDSKNEYQEHVADYFWLRAQADNIASDVQTSGDAAQPPANRVSTLLNNTGVADAQVAAAGEAVQLSFTHPSQAVVSSALAQLVQQGWQFTQLSMQQDPATKALQVQATLNP